VALAPRAYQGSCWTSNRSLHGNLQARGRGKEIGIRRRLIGLLFRGVLAGHRRKQSPQSDFERPVHEKSTSGRTSSAFAH
jgi:hypothetical protein